MHDFISLSRLPRKPVLLFNPLTDGESADSRGQITCPGCRASMWKTQDLNLRPTPEWSPLGWKASCGRTWTKARRPRLGHTLENSPKGHSVSDRPGLCPAQLATRLYPEPAKKWRVAGILSKRRAIKGSRFSHVCDTRVEVIYKENIYFMWSCFSAIHLPSEDWEQFDCCISNTCSTVISPLLSTSHLLPLPHTAVTGIFAQTKACRQKYK